MIRSAFGKDSAVFRTVAVAVAILTSIGGGSLLLQAGALGRPAPARLDLVRALGALDEYRRSNAVIQVGTHRYTTSCRDSWTTRDHMANVVIDHRLRVVEVGRQLVGRSVF